MHIQHLDFYAHSSLSLPSLYQALFYKAPCQYKSRATLTRPQPGCCSDPTMGEEEETLGKAPAHSQWDPCTEGHREARCLRRSRVATDVACIHQTSCSIHSSAFILCLMLSGRVRPHLTNTHYTVDLVASCRSGGDYSEYSCWGRHDPHWAARCVELLDRYKSVDVLKALLDCRQIPPIRDAGELNVPKYCVKTGIHTFVCASTTFPSGWKETAQLPVTDWDPPTTRAESLVSGLCFGSKRWDFDTHLPPSSAAKIWVWAVKYNAKLRTAMALFQFRRWRLPPCFP